MAKKLNQGSNALGIIIIITIMIIYNGIDANFFKPKRDAEAAQLVK
jgi:hypothetical protein